MSKLIFIPARYSSSRFMGKPLAKICGKPMIYWVYSRLNQLEGFETWVVTDHDLIQQEVEQFNGKCLRVDDDVNSGSERIYLAYSRFFKEKDKEKDKNKEYKLIVNVQGDEPLIEPKDIEQLAKQHLKNNWKVSSLYQKSSCQNDFNNPNKVKVTLSKTNRALYFSRSQIPNSLNKDEELDFNTHVGIYAYSPKYLEQFCFMPHSDLEERERLEQLRFLQNDIELHLLETANQYIGVDREEDISKVEKIMKNNQA